MSTQVASGKQDVGPNLREELWKIQHCQFEDLRFADTKAGALLTLAVALAAFTTANSQKAALPHSLLPLLIAEYIFAAAAVICSIGAIIPRGVWRYRRNPGPLMHFTGIANHQNAQHYLENVASVSTDLDMELARDIHRMARRAARKYGFVWCAVFFVAFELICFLVLLRGLAWVH